MKAQGSLEYLLLIGGALLVAVIVIALIIGITSSNEDETLFAVAHSLCSKFTTPECEDNLVEVKTKVYLCGLNSINQCRATKCGQEIDPTQTNALTKNLVALWHLNENVSGSGQTIIDSSGNGYNGTTGGNVNCTVPGKYGTTACYFDGSGDSIPISDIDAVENSTGLTVAAWVKFDPAGAGSRRSIVEKKGTGGANITFDMRRGSDWDVEYRVANNTEDPPGSGQYQTGVGEYDNGIPDTDSSWHSVAGVFNGSVVKAFTDGKIGTLRMDPLNGTTKVSSGTVKIGEENSSQYWFGVIDEVAIWNRALPDIAIRCLAQP